MNFSQRIGMQPARKPLQIKSMDHDLRVSLWNVFELIVVPILTDEWRHYQIYSRSEANGALLVPLWVHFFKQPLGTLPDEAPEAMDKVRDWFVEIGTHKAKWNKVYEFIEFVANCGGPFRNVVSAFVMACNRVLEREFSAYRFVSKTLVPITNEAEIEAIEKAASMDNSLLGPVSIHIEAALKLLSDKIAPDYRNSMKESISAVEAICKIIANNPTTTLGPALDAVLPLLGLHSNLHQGFKSIYKYTSDAHGIRHGLKDDAVPEAEDALFMLVSVSAFVNYLVEKARKKGLLPK